MGGFNQSLNSVRQKSQDRLNMSNSFVDEQLNEVSITNVQQINDKAYYSRRGRWIDSNLVEQEDDITPSRVIEFGSPEYFDLAERLARENRQGSIALAGDILLMVDGDPVLIKAPTTN